MAKYLFAYKGGAMAETEEARQKVMAAWGAWFGELGEAIADPGAPFADSASVTGTANVSDSGGELTGYSVIQTESLTAATELAKGCPVLTDGGTVEVYEAHEM